MGFTHFSGLDNRPDGIFKVSERPPTASPASDHTWIQSVIDDAAAVGGTVHIAPDTAFEVSDTALRITGSVTIEGTGWNSQMSRSSNSTTPLFLVSSASDVTFRDLYLTTKGRSGQFGLIEVEGNSTNVTIDHCHLDNGYAGVWVKGGNEIHIRNSKITEQTHPVYIGHNSSGLGDPIKYVSISGCDISSTVAGADGIKTIMRCSNIRIFDNSIHDCNGDGIDLFVSGDRVTIDGNDIIDNTVNGIDIKSDTSTFPEANWGKAKGITICNNRISSNTNFGINIVKNNDTDIVFDTTIHHNYIDNNQFEGIFTSQHLTQIDGNTIIENGLSANTNYRGVYILGSATEKARGCRVVNNTIRNNGRSDKTSIGVLVSESQGTIVAENTLGNDTNAPNAFQDNGVWLTSLALGNVVYGNVFTADITGMTDQSTDVLSTVFSNIQLA